MAKKQQNLWIWLLVILIVAGAIVGGVMLFSKSINKSVKKTKRSVRSNKRTRAKKNIRRKGKGRKKIVEKLNGDEYSCENSDCVGCMVPDESTRCISDYKNSNETDCVNNGNLWCGKYSCGNTDCDGCIDRMDGTCYKDIDIANCTNGKKWCVVYDYCQDHDCKGCLYYVSGTVTDTDPFEYRCDTDMTPEDCSAYGIWGTWC